MTPRFPIASQEALQKIMQSKDPEVAALACIVKDDIPQMIEAALAAHLRDAVKPAVQRHIEENIKTLDL